MKLGPPTLRVKNLEKCLSFYENTLGLRATRTHDDQEEGMETLALEFRTRTLDEPLLILKHDATASRSSSSEISAGLFHFAVLVPDRKSLASTYLALNKSGLRFDGFADHLVSESLYLRDPEDNGIEIYRDRPREEWGYDASGHIKIDTLPIDMESVLGELGADERRSPLAFPRGGKIGHMHLKVTNLERSVSFYGELGFDLTADWSAFGAMFLSVGGYHHNIAVNTWHSLNGRTLHKGDAGLENFTIQVSDKSVVEALSSQEGVSRPKQKKNSVVVHDPDGIKITVSLGKPAR